MVSYSIDWKGSACFDDVVKVEVIPTHIGTTSFSFQVEFSNYATEQAIASAKAVYVMVATDTQVKTTIPSDMKQQLEIGALGMVIDHASVK